MAIITNNKSVSFRIWAVTSATTLGSAAFAANKHQYWVALAALGLHTVAGLVKTYHDHGLRATEIKAASEIQSAFFYAAKTAADLKAPEAPQPV